MTRRYRLFGASALLLASCGGDGGGSPGSVAVVPAPTPTPAPLPAPTPSPTPSPSPTPPAPAAIEPYVLGTLSYTLAPDTPADKARAIRAAMDFAVAHTNTLGAFTGNIWVVYGANTPTADASFRGQIRFGGSIGRRVALHELAHWLGSGSVWQWSPAVANGRFTGALVGARIRAFDGAGAWLSADRSHFWPYGLNYDSEFSETQRNTQLVSAQVADMGIGSDATAAIGGVRRFQNRSSLFVLQGAAAGDVPIETYSVVSPAQQWRVSFADGFVTLLNVETGLAIEAQRGGNDVPAAMATATGAPNQQWEMMPVGEEGWFLLRNRATGNCLDNIGVLTAAASVRLWGCGFHPNQQWRLVR